MWDYLENRLTIKTNIFLSHQERVEYSERRRNKKSRLAMAGVLSIKGKNIKKDKQAQYFRSQIMI